jgi:hypothetical protein
MKSPGLGTGGDGLGKLGKKPRFDSCCCMLSGLIACIAVTGAPRSSGVKIEYEGSLAVALSGDSLRSVT